MNPEHTIDCTDLPRSVVCALEGAEGWLMLGNQAEARAELEGIPAEYRATPPVLAIEWRVAEASGLKEEAWYAAHRLCELLPDCGAAWICQANALRGIRGTEAAADLLLSVVHRFPSHPVILFNLACYCTQLGNLEAGGEWLLKAFELDEAGELKALSLLDPDLKPLWEGIGETFAKSVAASGRLL